MVDIISEVSRFYQIRNLPGFLSDVKNEFICKSDIVFKLQSYVFVNKACVLKQINENVIKHLYSLLTPRENFCVSVSLNYLEMHQVVLDIDFKKLTQPDLEFVKKVCYELVKSIIFILNDNENFEIVMLVKMVDFSKNQAASESDIFELAKHGVHFEIPSCVLYRGDNIWFAEVLKRMIQAKLGKEVADLIDSPGNWCLPYSKKISGETYFPVRKFISQKNPVYFNVKADDLITNGRFVIEHSIIKLYSPDSIKYVFELDETKKLHGFAFGYLDNRKINKRSQLTLRADILHQTPSSPCIQPNCLVTIEPSSLPHATYAISRFEKQRYSFVLGKLAMFKSLHPFTVSYLRQELLLHFKALFTGETRSSAIFNLYTFLILFHDRLQNRASEPRLSDEIFDEIDQEDKVVHYFNNLKFKIADLVEQVMIICNKSVITSIRTINPLLFIKCLFTQAFSEYNKVEFLYDESTNETLYLPSPIVSLINDKQLPIRELLKYMFPMFTTQKDGTVYFYEKNRWTISSNKLEHLFLPSKILNKFGEESEEEGVGMETVAKNEVEREQQKPARKKKRKDQSNDKSTKLYNNLIAFWGRVLILEFPPNLVSFVDGFVLLKHDFVIFFHSPIFRGQPSNLNWSKLKNKIQHISSPLCTYPYVYDLLNTSRLQNPSHSQKDGIIDYLKFNYSKEIHPELDIWNVDKCTQSGECPVYECLKYLLEVFSKDVELAFFMLWTLRYVLLGIPIKKAFILSGFGNNGKSTFSNVLRFLFGDSMAILSPDTIHGKISTLSPDIYNARNAKLAYTDDIHKINPVTLKQLVSGAFMYVRTLYHSGSGIQLKFFLMGSSNRNEFCGLDFATLKRILTIPFLRFFNDNSEYYCNNDTFEILAGNILATLFWLDKFAQQTNIYYDAQMNIVNPPKSVKIYSNSAVWKNDVTNTLLQAFNIREFPSSFIRVQDLISEINIVKGGGGKTLKYPLNTLFDDVETILNLLRHRFDVGRAINKSKNIFEDIIIGITIDKYKLLYDEALELL